MALRVLLAGAHGESWLGHGGGASATSDDAVVILHAEITCGEVGKPWRREAKRFALGGGDSAVSSDVAVSKTAVWGSVGWRRCWGCNRMVPMSTIEVLVDSGFAIYLAG